MVLTLDPVVVNTDLAKNYLEKYNSFDAFPAPGKVWHVKSYPDDTREHTHPNETNFFGSSRARELVEKIKEHESTFYQLEYLIRKTEKADFQNYFHLMCQHLLCDEDTWNLGDVTVINILMNEKTPLYALGCAAATKRQALILCIVTTQKMAPICHLFTSLCLQLGWVINLFFVNDLKDYNLVNAKDIASNVCIEERGCFSCTGVVTESADIDSALDVFINSSATAPWRLQRIYVQESAYDEVKEALAARCDRHVVPSCSEAFTAKGKIFGCDALGTERGKETLVPVEAYRTTKELCSLLRQKFPTPSLSVWGADSQLTHEIAVAAPANLVWINEYATFHGPPDSSIPVYEPLYSRLQCTVNDIHLRDLKSCWTSWNKLTKRQRLDSVTNALRGLSSAPKGYDSIENFLNDVLKVRDESFVSVDDGKICLGVVRVPLFEDSVQFVERNPILSVIGAINGMTVVYTLLDDPKLEKLLHILKQAGAPLIYVEAPAPRAEMEKNIYYKKLKVIRSNFGTIFAN